MSSQYAAVMTTGHSSCGVWVAALTFHIREWRMVLPFFPLLFVPVFTDALHTILISGKGNYSSRSEMLDVALKAAMDLFWIKAGFWFVGGLWGFIPLYGWMRSIDYRIAWGLSSNVVILEDRRDEEAIQRCLQLIESIDMQLAIRTMTTIPTILVSASFVLLPIFSNLIKEGPIPLLLWVAVVAWIVLPASAAANTFAYYQLTHDATPLKRL